MTYELPRVLTPALADRLGVSRARVRTEVRRGNWRVLARGALLTRPESPTRGDWAAVGLALAGPTGALSGWDAARVRGLGTARAPSPEVLVLSRHSSNRVVGHVRIRETSRPYATSMTSAQAGDYALTPVVSVARAVADASRYYERPGPARAMVTGAVQAGLARVEDFLAELRSSPRNHSAGFRSAVSDLRDGARSAAEARAARQLTAARTATFELNVPILDAGGRMVAVADVFWRTLRAVLEIDSREFHFSEASWKRTMARHNTLTRLGLAVTHYAPSQIGPRSGWLEEVQQWLAVRASELGTSLPVGAGVRRPPASGPKPFMINAELCRNATTTRR